MNTKTILTAALLIGCVALLQYHSIQFWTAHVDATTGWAWSLLLEGAALWLWSSPQAARRWLGGITTLLLVSGPLYHVSKPLVHEWQALDRGAVATTAKRAALEAEISSLETGFNTYLANSEKRAGWAGRIDQAQAALSAKRAELAALIDQEAAAPTRTDWQRVAIVLLQLLGICLLQGVGVLAIGELRKAAAQKGATIHRPIEAARRARLAAAA